jgi:hypothetical protein
MALQITRLHTYVSRTFLGFVAGRQVPQMRKDTMTEEFARRTVVTDHGDLLGTEERTALSLVQPKHPHAMSQALVKAVTQNKIRSSMAELAHGNIDNVNQWLGMVARDSPAKAVELFIELAKFSLPQMKETAVTVTQNNASRTYTIAELEAELAKPD